MKKHITALQLSLLAWICYVALLGNGCAPSPERPAQRVKSPQRLISTVPSITEILFDIGLGDRIVGDSRFTTYPPETKRIEKIGGFHDTNWEKIVDLKPDLVLMLLGKEVCGVELPELGIETLTVDHRSMEGVLESYDLIGGRFGPDVMHTAQARKAVLEEKLKAIQSEAARVQPVRVLICIDRDRESGRLQNVFVAGTSPYFQDAIRWAGGINVAETTGLPFPNTSVEGILAMNPDVIVDLMVSEVVKRSGSSSDEAPERIEDDLIADWKTLGNEVNAVKTGRIYAVTEAYATIPGPRTPLFVEKLFEILHGEDDKTANMEQPDVFFRSRSGSVDAASAAVE